MLKRDLELLTVIVFIIDERVFGAQSDVFASLLHHKVENLKNFSFTDRNGSKS